MKSLVKGTSLLWLRTSYGLSTINICMLYHVYPHERYITIIKTLVTESVMATTPVSLLLAFSIFTCGKETDCVCFSDLSMLKSLEDFT
jgi:hypothetical protein